MADDTRLDFPICLITFRQPHKATSITNNYSSFWFMLTLLNRRNIENQLIFTNIEDLLLYHLHIWCINALWSFNRMTKVHIQSEQQGDCFLFRLICFLSPYPHTFNCSCHLLFSFADSYIYTNRIEFFFSLFNKGND